MQSMDFHRNSNSGMHFEIVEYIGYIMTYSHQSFPLCWFSSLSQDEFLQHFRWHTKEFFDSTLVKKSDICPLMLTGKFWLVCFWCVHKSGGSIHLYAWCLVCGCNMGTRTNSFQCLWFPLLEFIQQLIMGSMSCWANYNNTFCFCCW